MVQGMMMMMQLRARWMPAFAVRPKEQIISNSELFSEFLADEKGECATKKIK